MDNSRTALLILFSLFTPATASEEVIISQIQLAPIFEAAGNGNLNIISLELSKGVSPNQLDEENGLSPLHYAVANNQIEAIKLLINSGANVNLKSREKWTPLHWAALLDRPEAAELLINSGAKRGIRGQEGRKALDLTTDPNMIKIIKKAKLSVG